MNTFLRHFSKIMVHNQQNRQCYNKGKRSETPSKNVLIKLDMASAGLTGADMYLPCNILPYQAIYENKKLKFVSLFHFIENMFVNYHVVLNKNSQKSY